MSKQNNHLLEYADVRQPRKSSLLALPWAFWLINIVYALDGFAYFGILIRLGNNFTNDLHIATKYATVMTGAFAAAVTLFMFGFGSYSERFGVRNSLIGAFFILTAGRFMLCLAPFMPGHAATVLMALASLTVMAIGEGVVQTANYSGIKQFSTEETSAAAFAWNYGLFQVGIMVVGLVSPMVRVPVENLMAIRTATQPLPPTFWGWLADLTRSGNVAVFVMCTAVTGLTTLLCIATFTKKAEARKLRPDDEAVIAQSRHEESHLSLFERIRTGPFGDARFTFFVFMLLPARTLFAHQIHTISLYIERAYPKSVQDWNETFSNFGNPLVVFIGAPIVAMLTRRTNMLRLMLVGSLVTALPTFLLCFGERVQFLILYIVLFSIGEAIWQPRFYQFAADLAPPGKMGSYMAAANIPWLLAKFTTGLYAGWMLDRFCPAEGPRRTDILWGIYGAIALISPIGLWLARNWLRAGLKIRHEPIAA